MWKMLGYFSSTTVIVAFCQLFPTSPTAMAGTESCRRVYCDEARPVHSRFDEAGKIEASEPDKAIAIYESIIRDFPNWADAGSPEDTPDLFSDRARSRIEVIRCRKARGRDHFAQSPQALFSEIKAALIEKKKEDLNVIASCDFEVGIHDSDVIWPTTPAYISMALIPFSDDFAWDKASLYAETVVVPLKDSSDETWFLFRKTSDGYVWWSFAASKDKYLGAATFRRCLYW